MKIKIQNNWHSELTTTSKQQDLLSGNNKFDCELHNDNAINHIKMLLTMTYQ